MRSLTRILSRQCLYAVMFLIAVASIVSGCTSADQATRDMEPVPDVQNAKTCTNSFFSFSYPSNWAVARNEKQNNPMYDQLVDIKSGTADATIPGASSIQMSLLKSVTNEDQCKGIVGSVGNLWSKNAEKEEKEKNSYEQCTWAGQKGYRATCLMETPKQLQTVYGDSRIVSDIIICPLKERGKTLLVTIIRAQTIADKAQPGFDLIERTFAFKDDQSTGAESDDPQSGDTVGKGETAS